MERNVSKESFSFCFYMSYIIDFSYVDRNHLVQRGIKQMKQEKTGTIRIAKALNR